MRGTQGWYFWLDGSDGIIPAYAGNTKHGDDGCANDRDHPRVCGEHLPPSAIDTWQAGSSPRMRGTHVPWDMGYRDIGIIPAYAGNTYVERVDVDLVGDHPRVCGEHSDTKADNSSMTGSSPRMRGTPTPSGVGVSLVGIIPAYAGNTSPSPKTLC